ncbi:hypothetical protein SMU102_09943, partial [Streptococcus mutans S1B]
HIIALCPKMAVPKFVFEIGVFIEHHKSIFALQIGLGIIKWTRS